ncbi:MAG: hypothetical protein NWR72_19790, partial [Bacteroidia bacterium]|nr:hypothetical protein [Bacteroidia bacterium]
SVRSRAAATSGLRPIAGRPRQAISVRSPAAATSGHLIAELLRPAISEANLAVVNNGRQALNPADKVRQAISEANPADKVRQGPAVHSQAAKVRQAGHKRRAQEAEVKDLTVGHRSLRAPTDLADPSKNSRI